MQGTQDTDTSPECIDRRLHDLHTRALGRRALENASDPTGKRLTAQQELGGGMVPSTEQQNPIDVFADDIETACLQDRFRRPDHVRLLGDLDIIGLAERGIETMTQKDKVILAKMLAYALAQLHNGMTQLATPGSGLNVYFQGRYGLSHEDEANRQESADLALQLKSLYDKVMTLSVAKELLELEKGLSKPKRQSNHSDWSGLVVVYGPIQQRHTIIQRPNPDQAA